MAILATCDCGRSLSLKNEFAGERIRCPDCGGTIEVPAIAAQAHAAFDRDRFLLRQRLMSIAQVYDVRGDDDAQILFVRRPSHILRSLLGILAALVVCVLTAILGLFGLASLTRLGPDAAVIGFFICAPLVGLAVLSATIATFVAIVPRRHVSFCTDPKFRETLLEVRQDSKLMPLRPRYTIVCPVEGPIARLSKNVLVSLLRKRWWCHDLEGNPICTAYEDSIILSLLRRLLGPMYGLLRTNYVIVRGAAADGPRIGEFNRTLTLFDRYVLDLSADPTRSLDRRIALALGVMLDTGEGR
jgi:hypothetical protein